MAMADPATMTNASIVKTYEANMARQYEINTALIEAGLGCMTGFDIRENPEAHPLIPEYLGLMDKARALSIEADLRYGPGLIGIENLVYVQGGRYRRKPIPRPGA